MKTTPTPVTAALTGVFSAIAWPTLWAQFGGASSGGSFELIIATLLVFALPAHAFVIGFGRAQVQGTRNVDVALFKRIGAWLVAGAVTAVIGSAARA